MVQFNTRANEILLKLVYYGPALHGVHLVPIDALIPRGRVTDNPIFPVLNYREQRCVRGRIPLSPNSFSLLNVVERRDRLQRLELRGANFLWTVNPLG